MKVDWWVFEWKSTYCPLLWIIIRAYLPFPLFTAVSGGTPSSGMTVCVCEGSHSKSLWRLNNNFIPLLAWRNKFAKICVGALASNSCADVICQPAETLFLLGESVTPAFKQQVSYNLRFHLNKQPVCLRWCPDDVPPSVSQMPESREEFATSPPALHGLITLWVPGAFCFVFFFFGERGKSYLLSWHTHPCRPLSLPPSRHAQMETPAVCWAFFLSDRILRLTVLTARSSIGDHIKSAALETM